MLEQINQAVDVLESLKNRIQWTHEAVLNATADLSQSGFLRQPGPYAPAIGWHVWHIARFADRLQAMLNQRPELWETNDLVAQWVLDPQSLGLMESGLNMPIGQTEELVSNAGKAEILTYATDVFNAVTSGLQGIHTEMIDDIRPSIFAYEWQAGRVDESPGRQAPLGEDLVRYLGHASRHLGMIEALLGIVFEKDGSASI